MQVLPHRYYSGFQFGGELVEGGVAGFGGGRRLNWLSENKLQVGEFGEFFVARPGFVETFDGYGDDGGLGVNG